MLSVLAVSIYMKIDQVMLGEMMGEESVGVYAAAVRLTEVWYFVPMAKLGRETTGAKLKRSSPNDNTRGIIMPRSSVQDLDALHFGETGLLL